MECRVAETLACRGLKAYLPIVIYHGKRGTLLEKPFFPRYIFAQFDWEREGLASVQWTPGLSQVVTFDGKPAWLSDAEVTYLRHALDQLDGDEFMSIKPGERVRVTGGPFRDIEAVFDRRLNGEQRVAILLDILGRRTSVIVRPDQIERIA
jgi:transcriptional antiterminator RfaH